MSKNNETMFFKNRTKAFVEEDSKFNKLEKYYDIVTEENKKINLTGFQGDRLWKEGIFESLLSLDKYLGNKKIKLLDIGAGAGFPSVPNMINNNNIELTIYEPLSKRVSFLKGLKSELESNFTVEKIRAEESKEKEKFNFVTARAVAHLKILIEISHHLGKVGSTFCFIKGPSIFQEVEESKWIFKMLNIVDYKIDKIEDDDLDKEIYVLNFKKITKTPERFPRSWQKIKKDTYD